MLIPIGLGIDQLRQSFHHFLDALPLEIAVLAEDDFSYPREPLRVYLVGLPLQVILISLLFQIYL